MKKAQFIILFFMTIPYDGLSQLDSLKSVLASSDADTTKIDLLFQMANLSENRDTSLTYYKRGVGSC